MKDSKAPTRNGVFSQLRILAKVKQRRLVKWLNLYGPPSALILLVTSAAVGLATGFASVLFRKLIDGISSFSFHALSSEQAILHTFILIGAPALGGIVVGVLTTYFASEAKGHGVPEVMEAVALRGGRIRPRVAFVKALASSICIGSGGSVGREGPIVQIGATLGSSLGQFLQLSEDRIRNLLACGVASGIAATFNAPIAGVFFALEIILGEYAISSIGGVIVSSMTGAVIGRAILGDSPAFSVPSYHLHSHWELLLYLCLGLLIAFVVVAYTRMVYWSEDLFARLKKIPPWLLPGFGGLLLGTLGWIYGHLPGLSYSQIPHIYGVGYDTIESALRGNITLSVALLLMVLKICATCITLGSGGSGGVFAPGLFIGAMAGCAFGLLCHQFFPVVTAPPGAYALVGTATFFAAMSGAAVTAIIMLFELTGDYEIILPLMLAAVVSTFLSRFLLNGESIYTMKLVRRGVSLVQGKILSVLQGVTVGQAMQPYVHGVSTSLSFGELAEEFDRNEHRNYPILDDQGMLFGFVTGTTFKSLKDSGQSPDPASPAVDIAIQESLVVFPETPIGDAMRLFSARGIHEMLVVSKDNPKILIGLIRDFDITQAYNLALIRQRGAIDPGGPSEVLRGHGTFVEVRIPKNSSVAGQKLMSIATALPRESLLISIHRKNELIIPHGDTHLESGDLIRVFVKNEQLPSLFRVVFRPRSETLRNE